MALVQKENLEGILALYNPACYYAGNRVYWIQTKPYERAYPITNAYQDVEYRWNGAEYEADEVSRFEYADIRDEDGDTIWDCRYMWAYNKEWRLFTLPPTAEELSLPWD